MILLIIYITHTILTNKRNQRIKTRNTFISRICRFSWNDSQIFGIITFFITSITSHIFFLVLSFSDTLNPCL